jgi:hypothetical protein
VNEQPPEGEEVVQAVTGLKERMQLGVQHLRTAAGTCSQFSQLKFAAIFNSNPVSSKE